MQNEIYHKLADFGRELLTKKSIVEGLPLISSYAKDVVKASRCSIFINDLSSGELWTTLSDGVDKIVVPSDKGIVAQTIKEETPIIANNPYKNRYFNPDIDKKTGFITKNIIAAPIFNAQKKVIGVLELLNKEGDFNDKDMKFVVFFSHYISGFLELINLYKNEA